MLFTNYENESIEFQICRENNISDINKLVAVDRIVFKQQDSLYLPFRNYDVFLKIYGAFFRHVLYSNLTYGPVDVYGINYISKEDTKVLVDEIEKQQLFGYEELLPFLQRALNNNGFYILGI